MYETGNDSRAAIDLATLEQVLRETEPAVMLLPTWLLENIIAADRTLRGPLFSSPHDRSHVISRDRLLQLAAEEDLPLPADPPDVPVAILLARPDNDWLASTPPPQVLLAYSRLLFHATIDRLFRQKQFDGTLDVRTVQQRIERVGRPAFREAAFVLLKERALPTGADDVDAYGEFAATYLELMHFEPWMLHWYFPAAEADRVLAVVAEDVDAAALLARTRLPGAAEPAQEVVNVADDAHSAPPSPADATGDKAEPDRDKGEKLVERALAAEAGGNDVRAALLRLRASRFLRSEAGKLRSGAARRLDALASRLRVGLEMDEASYDPWRAVLRGLLAGADRGWWNNERRLLYDLQKACICHEREIYSANVVEWLLDRGRRPLRRPQPAQRLVTAYKSLRSAERRAAKARLQSHDKAVLRRLLHAAVEGAEDKLRTELRPSIMAALAEGNLNPSGAVEKVAADKLVDELLDGVVRRGYLNLGNLRDAVSRNQLKLNDLSGPREFFGRDQLLRVDRKLEWAVDGVYHRGEVYLRLFQRLSSVLFGTASGRFLTRMLLIPFVGAFVLLEGLDHSVGLLLNKLAHAHVHFYTPTTLICTGLFITALVNWPAFRAAAARGGRTIGRGLRTLFVALPKWLSRLPLVRLMFSSHVARLVFRYAIKPLAIAALVLLLLPSAMTHIPRTGVVAVVYVVLAFVLNSPAGRAFEQTAIHALRVTLPRFTWDILAGLFRLVMNAFDRLLENVDRALYAVDEWLRFGATHNQLAVAAKASLGVVWFFIAYVTRFVVNLLVEPQINPIKHFPVVTVSHKIIIPTAYPMARALETLGIESVRAGTLAGTIVTCIPGVFGFLAWELKENWKLYRRNRPQTLRPVRVGSHGETLAQLLRPGFHSGTLPKLFARVRKSAKRSAAATPPGGRERDRETAHHVQEDVRAFVEREFANRLNRHALWAPTPVSAGEIELAVTRIRIELRCPALGGEPALLAFEQRDGMILASIDRAGWMTSLPAAQSELLRVGLIGLYKLAAVDVVAEHVRAAFAPSPVHFDVRGRKLIVWTDDGFERETAYDPSDPNDHNARQLLFRRYEVSWPLWRRVWDANGPTEVIELSRQIAADVEILPADCLERADRTAPAISEQAVSGTGVATPAFQTL